MSGRSVPSPPSSVDSFNPKSKQVEILDDHLGFSPWGVSVLTMGRKPNALILEFFERGAKLADQSNRYEHTCKRCGEVVSEVF